MIVSTKTMSGAFTDAVDKAGCLMAPILCLALDKIYGTDATNQGNADVPGPSDVGSKLPSLSRTPSYSVSAPDYSGDGDGGGSSDTGWIWLLGGVVAAGGVGLWLLHRRRARRRGGRR